MHGKEGGMAASALKPCTGRTSVRRRASVPLPGDVRRFIESARKDGLFIAEAKAAFQVLVDALVEQQNPATFVETTPC